MSKKKYKIGIVGNGKNSKVVVNLSKELTPKEALVVIKEEGNGVINGLNVDIIEDALTRLDELEEEINRIISIAESKKQEAEDERLLTKNKFDRGLLLGQKMTLENMIVNLRAALVSGDNKPLQNMESGE